MSEQKAVALGEDVQDNVEVVEVAPITTEERLVYIESRIDHLTESLDSLYVMFKESRKSESKSTTVEQLDKDIEMTKPVGKIPVGTNLIGITRGISFWLTVREDGFHVGINKFPSLSAAAEKVSGVRRSGLAFWKFAEGKYEGKTIKEVFKGV